MILSVSRRTDIPAFYSDWFFDCLKHGFVLVPNPINPKKIAKIPLQKFEITNVSTNLVGDKTVETKGNIEGIVFWSKNPQPLLDRIDELKDYVFYVLYTLNAYPNWIENGLPNLEERITTFKELSKHCPVIWRYDPILFAKGIDLNWHIKNFKFLCESLKGYTEHCKISFVIESYSGCSKDVHAPREEEKNMLLSKFSQIAKENNIKIEACAENGDWSKYDIGKSKCIDGEIFERILTDKYSSLDVHFKRKNDKIDGQRKNCGCMPAVDIGRYDTCRHGCNYCYARKGKQNSMYSLLQGEIYDKKTELEFEIK